MSFVIHIIIESSYVVANSLIFLKSKIPSYVTFPVAGRPDLIDIDMDKDSVIDLDGLDLRLVYSYIDNHEIYKRIEVSEQFKTSDSQLFEQQGKDYVYIGYDADDDDQVSDDNCYFRYTQAQSETTPPAYDIIDEGC